MAENGPHGLQFDWDTDKAQTNARDHQVTFEEAQTVFSNSLAVIFDDEVHSIREKREIIVGHSAKGSLLLVCFTEFAGGIRIISARRATLKEREDYEEGTKI